jgi:hypothetical protein
MAESTCLLWLIPVLHFFTGPCSSRGGLHSFMTVNLFFKKSLNMLSIIADAV